MKTVLFHLALLIAMGFVAASVVPTANAQRMPDMRVSIPFEFQAVGKTLPAGDYFVTTGQAYRRVDLTSADGHTLFLAGNPSSRIPGQRNSLVFHKYGNTYFLHEVLSTRQADGYMLPTTKAEKALTNIAGMHPVVETISAGSH